MTQARSIFNAISESETGTVYFLFDQVQHPEAKAFWQAMRLRPDVQWVPLWQGSEFEHFSEASPLLITVVDGNPGESLLYWLHDYTSGYERAGLVGRYHGDLTQIHQHWLAWCSIFYPDKQQAILRFYDATVLPLFWSVLTDEQQVAFRGAHHQLYVPVIEEQKPGLMPFFSQPLTPNVTAPQAYPVTFTQAQYDTFFYPERLASLIDTLYSKLAPNYAWLLPRAMVKARFYEGIALAQTRYPQADSLGQETFALYRFYLGDRFDEHPEFYRLLAFFPLREAIGQFNETFKGRDEALAPYRTEGWLGIAGHAELLP